MINYGTDQDVLLKAHDWLSDGHEVLLVTVLKPGVHHHDQLVL